MAPEILMLLCLKQAQEHFIDRVCSQAKTATTSLRGSKKDAPVFLRDHQDKLTRIAEFFYLMRASAPLTAERVEAVAREHNARLQRKVANTEDPWMNAKLRKGLFSPSAIRMLAMNNAAEGTGINLSQSDLARFFCATMSDELTRSLLVAARAGAAGPPGLAWRESLDAHSADPVFSIVGPLLVQEAMEPQGQA